MKFYIITILVIYLIYKLIGFLFRVFVLRMVNSQKEFSKKSNNYKKRPSSGNVDIEYVPENGSKKRDKNFKGGEYVDYEEVK